MPHSHDDGIVLACRRFSDRRNAVFVLGLLRVYPRVINIDVGTILLKFIDDVYNSSIANIGAILLEG
jgi:hypothetical protein